MKLKLVGGNPNAARDTKENHKRLMLQEMCPHNKIVVHNDKGIYCPNCAILISMVFEREDVEGESRILTFWIGEYDDEDDIMEAPNDLHDPA